MSWLNELPGSRPAPAGIERAVLRRMPSIFIFGTLAPILAAGLARLSPLAGGSEPSAGNLQMADILAIATVILHWTLVLTLTLACVIVRVMKGPAYVADAYPLQDAERPGD